MLIPVFCKASKPLMILAAVNNALFIVLLGAIRGKPSPLLKQDLYNVSGQSHRVEQDIDHST